MEYTVSAEEFYPEGRDEGRRRTVRHLQVSWGDGQGAQMMKVLQSRRKGMDHYTVWMLVQPHLGVPWAEARESFWEKLEDTPVMLRHEFQEFLDTQGLPADELLKAMDLSTPNKRVKLSPEEVAIQNLSDAELKEILSKRGYELSEEM